ncbi:MAG: hypothetical protein GY906_27820 [bacterium]|nr:hypothetical protein [bacterium]
MFIAAMIRVLEFYPKAHAVVCEEDVCRIISEECGPWPYTLLIGYGASPLEAWEDAARTCERQLPAVQG